MFSHPAFTEVKWVQVRGERIAFEPVPRISMRTRQPRARRDAAKLERQAEAEARAELPQAVKFLPTWKQPFIFWCQFWCQWISDVVPVAA
jgi:hypothetical protein